MLVYPIQILAADKEPYLADFLITQTFYAIFCRSSHSALLKVERSTKLDFDGEFFNLMSDGGFAVFMSPFFNEIIHNIQRQVYQQNYTYYQHIDLNDSDGFSESNRAIDAVSDEKIELINGFLYVNGRRCKDYSPENNNQSFAMRALVCGVNWYHERMSDVVDELGKIELAQAFCDVQRQSKKFFSAKAVYHLDASKAAAVVESEAFPVFSIIIYTMRYGVQRFDVSKGHIAFAVCNDKKNRAKPFEKEKREVGTHMEVILKHGMEKYVIDSFTNIFSDEWIVRLLDQRNAPVQNMLRIVKLDDVAKKIRDNLELSVNDFKNAVKRDLDDEERTIYDEIENTLDSAQRAHLYQELNNTSRRARYECTFSTRDDYRIASEFDKLGIFICGQTRPCPARLIIFSGRHYYQILELVRSISTVGK